MDGTFLPYSNCNILKWLSYTAVIQMCYAVLQLKPVYSAKGVIVHWGVWIVLVVLAAVFVYSLEASQAHGSGSQESETVEYHNIDNRGERKKK